MKAVGYLEPLPITNPEALLDIEVPEPKLMEHDLLVEVEAISVNPVDVKVRASTKPENGHYKILGWDAAGIVKEIGSNVTLFKAGDEVYYAGSIARQGTNAEFHVVDERIAGRKPKTLSLAQAAALPLTTITAWELLFDRLGLSEQKHGEGAALLIMGGAGGVGSILTQLARKLTKLTVIASASTPDTRQWCLDLGAHIVVDHAKPLASQLNDVGYAQIYYIASLTATEHHYTALTEIIAPQGRIGVIDDPISLDAVPLKRKSASLHWEFMFARSLYCTPDMIEQHNLLNKVAELVDQGVIRTTVANTAGKINAANLTTAHALLESHKSKGKLVLEGF